MADVGYRWDRGRRAEEVSGGERRLNGVEFCYDQGGIGWLVVCWL